ncbi:hypothetical protein GGI07_001957 [Coemansia sp. Benny D115]|nr:hypothetical protein GGI07_001957 [Coemansia sp. Benny D115]
MAAPDNTSECRELQLSEMEALAAIYGETNQFDYTEDAETRQLSGHIDIEVDSDAAQKLLAAADNQGTAAKHLPPIHLRFTLPPRYPLDEAPRIDIDCCWLDHDGRHAVDDQLADIWELGRGMGVLHSYADYLEYGLQPTDRIRVSSMADAEIAKHERRRELREFQLQTHSCGICMEKQSGKHCMRLTCAHVFCRACLQGYLTMLVEEGNLLLLRCPDPECRSQSDAESQQQLRRKELEELLSDEQLRRIDRLAEQRLIDGNRARYAWCPRAGCGRGVEMDRKVDRLFECTCGYVFCGICMRAWHGKNYCEMKSLDRILQQYIRVLRDVPNKHLQKQMERQYGAESLRKMLREYDTNLASVNLIRDTSVQCPKCEFSIQKTYGCNHMCCSQCGIHFCYLCGNRINSKEPMSHFNSAKSSCNQMLFEGAVEERDDAALQAENDETNLLIRLALGSESDDDL